MAIAHTGQRNLPLSWTGTVKSHRIQVGQTGAELKMLLTFRKLRKTVRPQSTTRWCLRVAVLVPKSWWLIVSTSGYEGLESHCDRVAGRRVAGTVLGLT